MRELMHYLPENYMGSAETVAFQEALQPEVVELWRARDELLAQLDPWTATWGLSLWEKALGIKNAEGLELHLRRRQIVAKVQGRGTTTVKVVEQMGETLLGVPCKVTEIYGEYRFELEPESGGKLPQGSAQLRERLEEILPAHLGWQLVVTVWMDYIIGTALGPRHSNTILVRRATELAGQIVDCAIRCGGPVSVSALPILN